ncbi:MAG: Stk1 family PASTA domain-containing Ser/Thr kinase [Actinobacteria bacterium]|nr:Stk1 family PASTA domain-containing Ser/Thr kinase [Actinomycetota bacterium]
MPDITTDTVIDGRYQVIGKVGSGGMAEVYGADDLQLGRKVAVKVLHRRFTEDEEFVERFRREAQNAAGLQHQHVVSVYDRGEWDGTYYIAMEFLEGRSLKDIIRDEGPLDALRAVDIAIQILRAARFAHRRGIIHRDLKPHNVILDEEDRAKVTDFGIARAGASDMTETGSIMGTAQYLSPEQAQGHAVSAQSDLYAIGIVLYEMLAGRLPFDAESAVTIALKQVSEAPPALSELRPDVPADLEAVTMRALEKDPAHRFKDADEFIGALEAVRAQLTGAPGGDTTAFLPPVGGPASSQEWEQGAQPQRPRRRRLWAVLAALLVAGVVIAALLLAGGPDDVTVPDVVGADIEVAQQRLRSEGFEVEITEARNPEPPGRVIGQDPPGRTEAPEGSTVNLTVSAGPEVVAVPDVVGEPRDEAVEALEDADFEVEEERVFSREVPAGRVIETRPGPGVQAPRGSEVTLIVSRGQRTARVPSVVGRQEAAATQALRRAGFGVDVARTEGGGPPGTVVAQDPAGGRQAAAGSTVTITVATAPEQVTVPDVVGLSESQAAERLSARGFQVDIQDRDVNSASRDGIVLGQAPDGRSQADRGATVAITVGRFEPEPEPGDGGEDEDPRGGPGSGSGGGGGGTGGTGPQG